LEREKCDAGVHEGTDAALQGSEEVAQKMRLQGEHIKHLERKTINFEPFPLNSIIQPSKSL
jgi:hypothetical protein